MTSTPITIDGRIGKLNIEMQKLCFLSNCRLSILEESCAVRKLSMIRFVNCAYQTYGTNGNH